MGTKEPMLNIRTSPDLLKEVVAAAELAGMNRSDWCRQVLEAVAGAHLDLPRLAEVLRVATLPLPQPDGLRIVAAGAPKGQVGGRVVVEIGRCLHPPHLVQELPGVFVCGGCQQVVRKR